MTLTRRRSGRSRWNDGTRQRLAGCWVEWWAVSDDDSQWHTASRLELAAADHRTTTTTMMTTVIHV